MSRFNRIYLCASSSLLAVGALLHLAAIAIGPTGYTLLGAPDGLIALIGTGSLRPAISCIVIACALFVASALGISAAGLGPRLPFLRVALGLVAAGLITRGALLPIVASWQPHLLRGICSRCQELNGFVLLTSALCLIVGIAYAFGALGPAPNNSFKPKLFRSTKHMAG